MSDIKRPSFTQEEALAFHAFPKPGKLEITATKPMATQRDLSLAYSPGVAVPVLAPELPPTVGGVLASIDGAYPGLRFRIVDEQGHVRRHIKLFVGDALTRDLATPIPCGEVLMIVAAVSGG